MMLRLTPAQKQFVQDNIPLSVYVAKHRYRRFHGTLGLEDLLSAAQFGLIIAALKYKASKADPTNKRWPQYAITIMGRCMTETINGNGIIKLPHWVVTPQGRAELARREAAQYDPPGKVHRGKMKSKLLWVDVHRAQNILNEEGFALT